jgi:RNA polymerase-binding transcription factor DksA
MTTHGDSFMDDAVLPAELLAHLRQRIARREAELAGQLRETHPPVHAVGEVMDFKELAGEAEAAALDDALDEQAVAELRQLRAARWRMDHGRYGRCDECGDAIDRRRLEALPHTPWCRTCSTALEEGSAGTAKAC